MDVSIVLGTYRELPKNKYYLSTMTVLHPHHVIILSMLQGIMYLRIFLSSTPSILKDLMRNSVLKCMVKDDNIMLFMNMCHHISKDHVVC